ncbi:hypothetical protein C8F01DRAFT_1245260 [Mycena amicta]|nr:hypothetical protein C8F01DRAFT_1245260 [Mycena amicta]
MHRHVVTFAVTTPAGTISFANPAHPLPFPRNSRPPLMHVSPTTPCAFEVPYRWTTTDVWIRGVARKWGWIRLLRVRTVYTLGDALADGHSGVAAGNIVVDTLGLPQLLSDSLIVAALPVCVSGPLRQQDNYDSICVVLWGTLSASDTATALASDSDSALEAYIRPYTDSIKHPTGTARIVDASVLPYAPASFCPRRAVRPRRTRRRPRQAS